MAGATRFADFNDFIKIKSSRRDYLLGSDLSWDIGQKGSSWKLIIKKGFKVNVSAPRLLEWAIDVHDKNLLAAAAIHDWLLEQGFDKAFASSEFRRALRARGVSHVKSWGLFFATLFWTIAADKIRNLKGKNMLNKMIRARWAIRTFIAGLLLGAIFIGGRTASNTMSELSERDTIAQHLIENHQITRGFENNAYGTYWRDCGVWITAGHVHKETQGTIPSPVSGAAVSSPIIDAAFYGDHWSCGPVPDLREGQSVWVAGYPGGSDALAMRKGEVYLKRSSSGSDGYEAATWIVVFPENNIAAWLSEPVAGGMSGGAVIDAETLQPLAILVTQNSPTKLQAFGDNPVHSADVVSIKDAYEVLIK